MRAPAYRRISAPSSRPCCSWRGIGHTIDISLTEVVVAIERHVAISSAVLLLQFWQLAHTLDTDGGTELNAKSYLLLRTLCGDHDDAI
jgi:hypothetical protein